MKPVYFTKNMSPYNQGEIAAFDEERAEKIVNELRAARYLTREELAADAERVSAIKKASDAENAKRAAATKG